MLSTCARTYQSIEFPVLYSNTKKKRKLLEVFLSVIGILGEKDNFISVADRIHAVHMIVLHFDN